MSRVRRPEETGTRAARDTMCRKAVCSWCVPRRLTVAWLTLAIPIVLCANAVGHSLNFRAGIRIDIVVMAGVNDTNVAAIGRIAATSHAKLLEIISTSAKFEELKMLSDEEIKIRYCEGMISAMIANRNKPNS